MMPNYRRRCLKPPTLRAALGSRLLIASRRRDFPITAYFSYHLKRYSNWHVDRSDLRPKAIIGYRHVNESWVLIFESVRIDANQVSEYVSDGFQQFSVPGRSKFTEQRTVIQRNNGFRQASECRAVCWQHVGKPFEESKEKIGCNHPEDECHKNPPTATARNRQGS